MYHSSAVWKCQCDCGKTTEKATSSLLAKPPKNVRSCGCLAKETSRRLSEKGRAAAVEKARIPNAGSLANRRYWQYKATAKLKGRPFELTRERFDELSRMPCTYCGLLPGIITGAVPPSGKGNSNSGGFFMGLDRANSLLGYVNSNVVPCCTWCNSAKMDRSVEEFTTWIAKASSHLIQTPFPYVL